MCNSESWERCKQIPNLSIGWALQTLFYWPVAPALLTSNLSSTQRCCPPASLVFEPPLAPATSKTCSQIPVFCLGPHLSAGCLQQGKLIHPENIDIFEGNTPRTRNLLLSVSGAVHHLSRNVDKTSSHPPTSGHAVVECSLQLHTYIFVFCYFPDCCWISDSTILAHCRSGFMLTVLRTNIIIMMLKIQVFLTTPQVRCACRFLYSNGLVKLE